MGANFAMVSPALPTGSAAPRAAVRAVLLSVVAPGVGHLYLGFPGRGAALFAALLGVGAAVLAAAFLVPPTFAGIVSLGVAGITATLGAYLSVIVDAARLARAGVTGESHPWYVQVAATAAVYLTVEIVLLCFPAIAALQPWRTFDGTAFGMEPTLRPGEIVIADMRYYAGHAPARGDVAVYRLDGEDAAAHVKRIVALAGDRIAFRGGLAVVNGVAAREPYAKYGDPSGPFNNTAETTVPAGSVFVAGDSRDNSLDSRDLARHGPVPVQNLTGRATEILSSPLPDRAGTWVGTAR